VRIRLSDAQVSALECRGLEEPQDALEALLARSWQGDAILVFDPEEAEDLAEALCDASNAEDAYAELACEPLDLRGFARRASRSLAALMMRVARAAPRG